MDQTENFLDAVLFIAVVFALWLIAKLFGRTSKRPDTRKPLKNGIIVDGSNVMHWGGEPSARVLRRVIDHLRSAGLSPYVIFDANVGYKLQDRYLDDAPMAKLLGLPVGQVLVVEKGQIADEIILQFARDSGHRIVSNDRFRDWSVQYKFVKKKGRMVRGTFSQGAVRMPSL